MTKIINISKFSIVQTYFAETIDGNRYKRGASGGWQKWKENDSWEPCSYGEGSELENEFIRFLESTERSNK